MLGKKIDKQLIKHVFGDDEDEKASTSVGAAFQEAPTLNPTYDQLCKLREDPLIAIRKAEQQKAKEVVDNPVLMKKFKTYLMEMVNEDKSKKKKKKHKHVQKNSPEFNERLGSNERRKKKRSNDRKRGSNSYKRKHRSKSNDTRPRSESSSVERNQSHESKKKRSKNHHHRSSRSRSASIDRQKSLKKSDKQRSRSRSKSISPIVSRKPVLSSRGNSKTKYGQSSKVESKRNPFIPPKMSTEELQRKREQMMQDAKDHEKARISQLKSHEKKLAEEEKQYREQKYTEDPSRFGSTKGIDMDVAERIRTKLNTLQRTKHADEKFLKR